MLHLRPISLQEAADRLSRCTAPSPFQGEPWWRARLADAPEHFAYAIRQGDDEIGLCGLGYARRLGMRRVYFNEIGDVRDGVTIEYNRALLYSDQGIEAAKVRQALPAAISAVQPVDELVFARVPENEAPDYGAQFAQGRVYRRDPSYVMTRLPEKIRRRLHKKGLPVEVVSVRTLEEAITELDALWTDHRARHKISVEALQPCRDFHVRLMQAGRLHHDYDVLRLIIDEGVVGRLYHLLTRERACYYAGGFDYAAFGERLPGLSCYAAAAAYHAERGRPCYDFLGGDYRYKREMGVPDTTLVGLSMYAPGLRARCWAAAIQTRDVLLRRAVPF